MTYKIQLTAICAVIVSGILIKSADAQVVKPANPPVQRAAFSAPAVAPADQATLDVKLRDGNRLAGQVFDQAGRPAANEQVVVRHEGGVSHATTNANGQFVVDRVSPGVHAVQVAQTDVIVRCWNSQAAPPVAQDAVVVKTSVRQVQRCTNCKSCKCRKCCDRCGRGNDPRVRLRRRLLIGAGIGAAIAIPIALSDDDPPAS